jgi:hypothetical protein
MRHVSALERAISKEIRCSSLRCSESITQRSLKAAAATFHPIGETGLHLLELIEDKADGRIDGVGGGIGGIGGLGAVGVVIGVGLHDRSG